MDIVNQILAYREFTLGQWVLIAGILLVAFFVVADVVDTLRRRWRHRQVRKMRDEYTVLRGLKGRVL